jgi:hypothetical protein
MADDRGDRKNWNQAPTWDGEESGFDHFQEKLEWHLRGIEEWKVKLELAKCAKSLTGTAWKRVSTLSEVQKTNLVSNVQTFLQFLKQGLVRGPIAEAGSLLLKYLLKFRRQNQESMKGFVDRHRQVLAKLEGSLRTVMGSTKKFSHLLRPKIIHLRKAVVKAEGSEAGSSRKSGGSATSNAKAKAAPARVWGQRRQESEEQEEEGASEQEEERETEEEPKDSYSWKQDWWKQQSWSKSLDKYAPITILTRTEELEETIMSLAKKLGGNDSDVNKLPDLLDKDGESTCCQQW